MQPEEKLLKDYTDNEKGAYMAAIASIATADRTASEDELDFLEALADAAELSPEQKLNIRDAALNSSGDDLKNNLDVLKTSELRFSLITDLVAFAESDQQYTAEERTNVERIAWYLDIKPDQFSTISQYVQKASVAEPDENNTQQQGLFGMEDKFKKAGLNLGSITKGLLGIAGPMILASLVSKGLGGRKGGGLLGGLLGGGLAGGLGGMLGGGGGNTTGNTGGGLGGMLGGGGLGSLIGMLNGGRGMSSTGGLLGKVLGGKF